MKFALLILALALTSGCANSPVSATPRLSLMITAGPSLEAGLSYDRWESQPVRKEVQMGRWASASKRGAAALYGSFQLPAAGDFAPGVITTTTIPVNRVGSQPAGASGWGIRVIRVATGAVAFEGDTTGASLTATGLVTGNTYQVFCAWFQNGVRASEWRLCFTTSTL